MRLWHQDLISKLPRQQLLGQHRECAALRGNGWNKKHATVQYIFNYSPYKLYQYHLLIMNEMKRRGYSPNNKWFNSLYRGKNVSEYHSLTPIPMTNPIYIEHDNQYFISCINNLKEKGIIIDSKDYQK